MLNVISYLSGTRLRGTTALQYLTLNATHHLIGLYSLRTQQYIKVQIYMNRENILGYLTVSHYLQIFVMYKMNKHISVCQISFDLFLVECVSPLPVPVLHFTGELLNVCTANTHLGPSTSTPSQKLQMHKISFHFFNHKRIIKVTRR